MTFRTFVVLAAAVTVSVNLAAQGHAGKTDKILSQTGQVTAVTEQSLTIERGKQSWRFIVDTATLISVRGATAKTRERQKAGAPGLVVTDLVREGNQVTVRYRTTAAALQATEVRVASF